MYLVGGAARCGKTVLARKLLADAAVPWFSLDALRVGLTRGLPGLGLDLAHDDLDEAERLWPVVGELIENILFWDLDYLVEGSCLLPAHAAELVRRRSDKAIRVLFLGCPGLTPEAKLDLIDTHRVGGNDWLAGADRPERLAHAARAIRDSLRLERLAADAGLPFFDTGADFQDAIDRAAAHLRGH